MGSTVACLRSLVWMEQGCQVWYLQETTQPEICPPKTLLFDQKNYPGGGGKKGKVKKEGRGWQKGEGAEKCSFFQQKKELLRLSK